MIKVIISKLWDALDYGLPISMAAGGGAIGSRTAQYLDTAISAIIFAVIGGVVGYLIKILMDKCFIKKGKK